MPLTLTIGKNPTGKPSTIDLTIDNPHLLILGAVGAGKTVMCEHITNINKGTEFVYLGRDERNAPHARPFHAVAEDNFHAHAPTYDVTTPKQRDAITSTLNAAATRAIELGAVLIIEETTLYLEADRAHFFNTVGDLTEAGVHIIFTAHDVTDEGALRRLAIGNIALLCEYAPSAVSHAISLARSVGIPPTKTTFPDTPINRAYPELAAENYPTARRGEFILRTPSSFDVTTQVVPSPR